jgi:hypothetical protein
MEWWTNKGMAPVVPRLLSESGVFNRQYYLGYRCDSKPDNIGYRIIDDVSSLDF